jgi:hypothetical protein
MASLLFLADRGVVPGLASVTLIRRAAAALRDFRADLAEGIAASRRDHQLRRLRRNMDRRLLKDLGLDRDRC